MSFAPTFTPKQLDSLKKVAKSEKAKNNADAVGMAIEVVGEVATSIITTVWAVRNEEQRKFFEEQIQYLDEKQAGELEANLRIINNQEARVRAITQFFSKVVGDKSAKDIKGKIEQRNLSGVMTERKKIIYIFGGIVVLLIGLVVIKKIMK
jgi:hypothetical protein